MITGPVDTPYEHGLFVFDVRLPPDYPASPPVFFYLSQCSGRLNPNLYDDGKVCVSLLGTWAGRGSEVWTSKSNVLQVLVSIQGIFYYNTNNVSPCLERFSFQYRRTIGISSTTLHDRLKILRHFFIQSGVRPKPIMTLSGTFSRTLRQQHVMTSSLDWFTGLSVG